MRLMCWFGVLIMAGCMDLHMFCVCWAQILPTMGLQR